MIISRSIPAAANGIISFFFKAEYYFIVYVPYLYLFICCWILSLLACLGYCKQCFYEHWSLYIFSNLSFHLFQLYCSIYNIRDSLAPQPYHWPWTSKLPQTLRLQELNASNTREREETCTSPVKPPEENSILADTWIIALWDPEQRSS